MIERDELGLLGDADRPLALDVGVAAHRADAGAGLADLAAHQKQVHQGLDAVDPELVLGQPHPVDRDDRLCLGEGRRGCLDGCARKPRFRDDLGPAGLAQLGLEGREIMGVLGDEGLVEHKRPPGGSGLVVPGQQHLADTDHRRDVAAGADLVVLRRDLRRRVGDHLARALGADEGLPAALAQRVEDDDGDVALAGLLQIMQQPRRVGADILPEGEDAVGLGEILEQDGAHGRADALRQRDRGGFVAHVGAVGQVVVPVEPRKQLVHVGGLERGPSRGIEDRLLGVVSPELRADIGEGLVPGDLDIAVAGPVVARRMRQPPLVLQIVVGPAKQFGHRVTREELGRRPLLRHVPECRLRAVLAELGEMRFGWLGPGTAGAGITADLVVVAQQTHRRAERPLLDRMLAERRDRAPPSGGLVVWGVARATGHSVLLLGSSRTNGSASSRFLVRRGFRRRIAVAVGRRLAAARPAMRDAQPARAFG